MKNIIIVAAENSAENYGARVIDEFNRHGNGVRFFGLGGDRFQERGVDVLVHNKELAVIGLFEVVSSIVKLKRTMNMLLSEAKKRRAEAAFLIDYPDFNLRMARKLREAGIPVYYYISPTVWAWRYARVKLIRKYVDHLFIIFPFEIEIYRKERIPFTYTGHPLIPMIKVTEKRADFRKRWHVGESEFVITLLPGSRRSEVAFLLPEMAKAMRLLQEEFKIKIFLLKAQGIEKELIGQILADQPLPVHIVDQPDGHNLINASDFILTTCGTSNLEIAILGVPFAAVYRLNRLSYLLGKRFVKIKNYSIVNILAQKRVIPELIQGDFTARNMAEATRAVLRNRDARDAMLQEFAAIRRMLSQQMNPSEIIYKKISNDIFNKKETRSRVCEVTDEQIA